MAPEEPALHSAIRDARDKAAPSEQDSQPTSLLALHTPLLQQALSVLADVAAAPDRQIRVEAHPFRQSLESFQVQLTKI